MATTENDEYVVLGPANDEEAVFDAVFNNNKAEVKRHIANGVNVTAFKNVVSKSLC